MAKTQFIAMKKTEENHFSLVKYYYSELEREVLKKEIMLSEKHKARNGITFCRKLQQSKMTCVSYSLTNLPQRSRSLPVRVSRYDSTSQVQAFQALTESNNKGCYNINRELFNSSYRTALLFGYKVFHSAAQDAHL